MSLKLLSYNIRFGGAGRENQLATVINEVAPDLVIFQEATRPDVIERIAKETAMNIWACRPRFSLAFMSRVDIASYEWHRPPGARHSFLEIVPAETECRIFGLHLSAVHSNWTERRRVRELRALLDAIHHHQHGFHAIVGDFNTLAPGEILDVRDLPMRLRPLVWLSGGKIRWETIQIMLDAGYVDGYRALNPNDKGLTFPVWKPHVRLDYLFLPSGFVDRLTACSIITEKPDVKKASDHFPLLAQLAASARQNENRSET